MGNAGRVLMIPKGDYNAATTYEMLDCVYYNGRSYVCKQTSTGHAPTDTTYWQPMTPDASAEIQALTNQLNTSINDLGAKNSLPFNMATIKALNTTGTWNSNAYTENGLTYTIQTDSAGNVIGIDVNGTAVARVPFYLCVADLGAGENVYFYNSPTVNGYTYTAGDATYERNALDVFYRNNDKATYIIIDTGKVVNHVVFKPMRRPAGIADDTFAPYAKTNVELTDAVNPLNKLIALANTKEITGSTAFTDLQNMTPYKMGSGNPWYSDGYVATCLVIKYSSTIGFQIAFKIDNKADVSSETLAYRICHDGTYSNWAKLSGTNVT